MVRQLSVVGVLLLAGWTANAVVADQFDELPAQVARHEAAIDSLRANQNEFGRTLNRLDVKIDQVLCVLIERQLRGAPLVERCLQ